MNDLFEVFAELVDEINWAGAIAILAVVVLAVWLLGGL